MEPEESKKPSEKTNDETLSTLRDEGIEVVEDSRHADENEFDVDAEGGSLADITATVPEARPAPEPVPRATRASDLPIEPVQKAANMYPKETAFTGMPKDPGAAVSSQNAAAVRPVPVAPSAPKQELMPAVPKVPELAPLQKPAERPAAKPSLQDEINRATGVGSSSTGNTSYEIPRNNPTIKAMRTFKSDAEEAVRYQNVSSVQIAVAESVKKEAAGTPIERAGAEHRTGLAIALFALAILVVGGGAYVWLSLGAGSPRAAEEKIALIPAPLSYDQAISFDPLASNDPVAKAAELIRGVTGTVGDVVFIVAEDGSTTTSRQVMPGAVFGKTDIPDKLSRSLSRDYMIGAHIFEGNVPFIILKTTFYQNAFPGMLEWEKSIRNDLLPLIRISHPTAPATTLTTDLFSDKTIANKDVRILSGENGFPILYYVFPDKDTILITTEEKTLLDIMNRLLSVRVIQ